MANAYNQLVNTFKSPSATEQDIVDAFHSYYKNSLSFCFNKTHISILKKLNREFVYKFLFDQGYIFSLKDNTVAHNAFLIYNTYDFYLNPNKTLINVTKSLNDNQNKPQLKDIQYIYEHYKSIHDIIEACKVAKLENLFSDIKAREISIGAISDIKSKHPIYQKFILLNLFNYDFKLSYFIPLFESFKDTSILNFFIRSFSQNFPLGVHYVPYKGRFDNGYFNPKYFPQHDFLLFLSNNNLLHLFDNSFLIKYLKYDFVLDYLKNNLLNDKNFYNNENNFIHYEIKHMFENIFSDTINNFEKFIIFMFENIQLNKINFFFKHDCFIANRYKKFNKQECFNILKRKFSLFCQSDFDDKILSQKSFFLNDFFTLKENIQPEQLFQLIQFIHSEERTLNKFKKNSKFLNSEIRSFFLLDDF